MNYEDLIGSLLAEIRTIFLAIIIINVLCESVVEITS